jgi:hypothetical protein
MHDVTLIDELLAAVEQAEKGSLQQPQSADAAPRARPRSASTENLAENSEPK